MYGGASSKNTSHIAIAQLRDDDHFKLAKCSPFYYIIANPLLPCQSMIVAKQNLSSFQSSVHILTEI